MVVFAQVWSSLPLPQYDGIGDTSTSRRIFTHSQYIDLIINHNQVGAKGGGRQRVLCQYIDLIIHHEQVRGGV